MAFVFHGLAEGVFYSGVIALNEMPIHKLHCQRTFAWYKCQHGTTPKMLGRDRGQVPTLRDPSTTILRDFVAVGGFFAVDMTSRGGSWLLCWVYVR